ncbi:MAG: UvrD-helicase domain-containing protein, partial [Firmicutes bacterium]|nr:UvrD-helicase domain-containing protein [Bacillota bacterium]
MASFHLTPSQYAAVHARGDSILVSAGAGSGKTRVLVERLLSYITDESDPKNIDNFLVITYTRAAAAELRSRILGALNELLSARPNDRRLRRQISLCNTAAIGTIHSFCTGLLREYGHLLDISPDFKIPDEDYAAQLKASALEKLLEARYAHIEEDAAFRALVDTVGAGLDDARLMRLVLSLHTKLRSQPYPETWAREQMGAFAPQDSRGLEDTVWGAYLLTRVRELLDYWGGEMKALCALLARRPVGNYLDSVSVTSDAIRALRRAAEQSWDAAYSRLPVPFPRLNTPKGMGDSDTATEVKRRRGACKKAMEGLTSTLFAPAEELRADLLRVAPAMEALLGLTLDFDAAYRSEKRRLGLLDFSDLEHFTAKLLLDEETGARTWLAAELCQRYTEILVDEYQDVNKIQDLIFHALSRQDRNLFLVGDVKQSIYRFRLADPALFLEKLNRFSDLPADGDITALRAPTRIPLRENFRSRAGLLEAVNGVFETLMTEELGEVDYKNGQGLIPSAIYPESDRPCCTLYTLALLDSGEDEEAPNRLEAEAEFVAGKIDGMLRTGAAPGDIAILLRSPSGAAGTFHAALSRRGIPVESAQGGSFFASAEILSLMSLLAVIDNPRQDVPLIAALGSPLFGFTPDQFSEIRAAESGDFYDALCVLAEDRDKNSADFLSLLASLRALASDLPVSELLAQIYARTSAEAVFAALPGGEARLRNLEALLDCATAFEAAGWRGLFAFNAWLNRLKERGEEPAPGFAPAGGNAVRILSIHKSKGLEFPIVFLSDTARQWNKNDLREPVLVHGELGLGPRVTDADRGLEYPSLAFRAVGAKLNAEAMSEELRVLYVAMTRAREQLHITCALRDPAETIEKLRAAMPPPLSPVTLAGASSPAMWLLAAGQAGQLTM